MLKAFILRFRVAAARYQLETLLIASVGTVVVLAWTYMSDPAVKAPRVRFLLNEKQKSSLILALPGDIRSLHGLNRAALKKAGLGPKSRGYAKLMRRTLINGAFLPRYQFELWKEALARKARKPRPRAKPKRAGSLSPDSRRLLREKGLKTLWREFQEMRAPDKIHGMENYLEAPLNIRARKTMTVPYGKAAYIIERFTFDALPGLAVPAVIYRPARSSGTRLPIILNPPACGESIGLHNPGSTSVQRRLANQALAGMLGFYMEGFCVNGPYRANPYFNDQYESYAAVLGLPLRVNALYRIMWNRVLRILMARSDTDPKRIGGTGYSYGSAFTKDILTNLEYPLAAVGYVGDLTILKTNAVRTPVPRHALRLTTRFSYRENHMFSLPYSGGTGPEDRRYRRYARLFLEYWGSTFMYHSVFRRGLTPIFVVTASGDPWTKPLETARSIRQLPRIYRELYGRDARRYIRHVNVRGGHNYNMERRALLTRWFARVLKSEPLLPFPKNERKEHHTMIVPPHLLDEPPRVGKQGSLYSFFREAALRHLETGILELGRGDVGRARLRRLLKIDEVLPRGDSPAPLVLDEYYDTIGGVDFLYRYFLIPINEQLSAGLAVVQPLKHKSNDMRLFLSTNAVLPEPGTLKRLLKRGEAVAAMVLPGYGIAGSAQRNAGNLAVSMSNLRGPDGSLASLLIVQLGAAERLVEARRTLLASPRPPRIYIEAVDPEAGILAYFLTALRPEIEKTRVYRAVVRFEDFITNPAAPYPMPIMITNGLFGHVRLPDLVRLAGRGRIQVMSKAQFEDLLPYSPLSEAAYAKDLERARRGK